VPAIRAADVAIRPLRPEDTAAAAAVAHTSLGVLYPEEQRTPAEEAIRVAGSNARVAHLQRTDPGGCWVADHDGRVVGVALGLIRDGVWGLSLFALLPEYQGLRIGTRLYAPALEYGAGEPGGIILSSPHPAAMRRYARSAGYRLLPAVALSGAWDPERLPTGLRCRPGDLAADAQTIEAASRHVRGASHMRDLPTLLGRPGVTLLVLDGEGFACAHEGTAWLLAARSEAAAEDLLWGAIGSGPRGGTVSVDFVTAENQWAIRVGLEAGLALSPDGPVFVRGEVGPMAPYIPSGAYL
jgi:ribosomal protein S18 acetylase RimI-like enzyme